MNLPRTKRAKVPPDAISALEVPKKLLAAVPITIRWRDLDAFNHVNNATFLTYLEEARLVWLSGLSGWFSETTMPVLAAIEVNYRAQLVWPGGVIVELYCERIGHSSLTVSHRIIATDASQRLHADGQVTMVWIEPASGRATALPEAIHDACQ